MNIFVEKSATVKLPEEWVERVQVGKFYSVMVKKLGGMTLDEISRMAKNRFGNSAHVEVTKPGTVRVTYESEMQYIHLEPEETWRLLRAPGICLYSRHGRFWIGVKE